MEGEYYLRGHHSKYPDNYIQLGVDQNHNVIWRWVGCTDASPMMYLYALIVQDWLDRVYGIDVEYTLEH